MSLSGIRKEDIVVVCPIVASHDINNDIDLINHLYGRGLYNISQYEM